MTRASRALHYILKERIAIPCPDLIEWATWMERSDRTVARTEIEGMVVSTVFLGIDLQHFDGEPLLFETMVLGDESFRDSVAFEEALPSDSFWGPARRDTFWCDAEQTHQAVCAEISRRIERSKAAARKAIARASEEPSGFGLWQPNAGPALG